MKTKVSPALVGLFVLGALTLALVALFSFGGINFFSRPQRFAIYFDESIHGLDLGSPVKLRGVRVGRVVGLNVRYQREGGGGSVVAVICELNRNVIMDETGVQMDVSDRAQLQLMIDRGLRAHLGVLGLATGLLFVELDFYNPEDHPPTKPVDDLRYVVVPAVPSAISEFQASLSEILADVKRIDFAGIANELRGLLVDTRKQVSGLNLAALNAEWTRAGRSVSALVESPEVKDTFVNLKVAIDQLNTTLGKIDTHVDPAGEKLNAVLAQAQTTMKTFDSAAAAARNFIAAQGGLGEEAGRALQQLGEAAASVQRLADFLERNPNALISGRKAGP